MTSDQALTIARRHYAKQYGDQGVHLQQADLWIIASILEAAHSTESKPKMSKTEILGICAILVVSLWGIVASFNGINQIDAERKALNQSREITLKDGTPCVINQNGGIACNWKEIHK